MNLLKIAGLSVGNMAKDFSAFLERELKKFVGVADYIMWSLFLALALTVVGMFAGVAIAASGHVEAGRTVILAGGLTSIILFTLFNTNSLAATYAVMLATQAGHAIKDKVPELTQEKADSILKWLRGITLWIMLASFYAMVLPVWENVGGFVTVLACMVLIATMASAWDLSGTALRKIAILAVIGVFTWNSFQFLAPETSASLKSSVGYLSDRLNSTGYRSVKIGEVEQQAKKTDAVQAAAQLKKIRGQQAAIRLKAVQDEKCFGVICDKDDAETYAKLEEAARTISVQASQAVEPDKSSVVEGVANLAPPQAPPVEPTNKTPVAAAEKSKAGKLTAADLDRAFAGLE